MKREYAATADRHLPSSSAANILPHHHKFHLQPPPHLRCPPTSEEADSHSHSLTPERSGRAVDDPRGPPLPPPSSGDDSTIEVVRRPRGRPPGSKNKPKAPAAPTRESPPGPSMSPYVLELPPGVDVVDATERFCQRRGVDLCVLSGHGLVANVALRQPSATTGATVTFHGHFDVLSISATVLLPGGGGGASLPPAASNAPFAITLAGPQGQVVGGLVAGPLVSAGTVYLIAATFSSPSFERLGAADHDDGADGNGGLESSQAVTGGETGGAPVYSYQPADVIWAPTARQPSAPPY
ncbi:AT-hook motif nuclear-localized protein 17 [Striga hermonthica]|uniref:AT-hook motif nuclear-localized protein 17 n=1 Tax=Striga hermonthica TaxID=68872 RepID=A0A9N7R0V4_STRHE|nr:AT-hook motif nuclear-localized protein 17 [Striga hermonthica]